MNMLCVVVPILFAQPPFESNPSSKHEGPERGQGVSAGIKGDFRLAPVPGMAVEVNLARPGAVRVSGHVGFQMEGNANCTRRRHDLSWMTGIDVAVDDERVRGTYATENWVRHEHYHDMAFATLVELDAGAHVIEVRAEALMLNGRRNSCEVYFKSAPYHGMTVELLQPCDRGGGS